MYNEVEKEAGTGRITKIVDSLGFKIIAALHIYTRQTPCTKIQRALRAVRGEIYEGKFITHMKTHANVK